MSMEEKKIINVDDTDENSDWLHIVIRQNAKKTARCIRKAQEEEARLRKAALSTDEAADKGEPEVFGQGWIREQ